MNADFDELATRFQTNQGSNLASIIAYGSATAHPGKYKKADYQVLVVLKRLSAGDLRQARKVVSWWTAEGYSIPVFFTVEEVDESLDVYPIEFRHIKRTYQVIYGDDLIAGKEVSNSALRWQIEHELRGKLLRLRSLYMPASTSGAETAKLMTESVVTFVRFWRPVLEILGEDPPLDRLKTIKRVGERLNIDTSPVARVLQMRNEPNDIQQLMDIEVQDLFASYLDCLDRVIDAVDNM